MTERRKETLLDWVRGLAPSVIFSVIAWFGLGYLGMWRDQPAQANAIIVISRDLAEYKRENNARSDRRDAKMDALTDKVEQVAKDTAWIRGKIGR